MRTDIAKWTVSPEASIRATMKVIDDAGLGIVLVIDQLKLMGTITDGDVRRAILRSVSLEQPCHMIMNRGPIHVSEAETAESAKRLMLSHKVRHLPVVTDGNLVGLWCLDETATQGFHAVVMAGGLGSRLGDLTRDTPKPLLHVGGRPILEHIVEHLQSAGIDELYITTRYLAEQIETHFGEGDKWGVNINYIREQERLGTAGSLKYLEGRIEHSFLVMNGDLLTDFRVADMFTFHQELAAHMTVAVRHYTINVPFGVVSVDGTSITKISEKPNYEFFVNAGIYIVHPSILHLIESGRIFDITELIEKAISAGYNVVSFPMFEDWLDVGRPEDLLTAHTLHNRNTQ